MNTSKVFFFFFFLRHDYKNYLNVLFEPWPNLGLVKALSVKPGHNVLPGNAVMCSLCAILIWGAQDAGYTGLTPI